MGKKKRQEESNDGIPAWIVSFSDMVTLLLAFFVMLQAFAKPKQPEEVKQGLAPFQSYIKGMGTPNWLQGKKEKVKRQWFCNKFPAKPDEDSPENSDANNTELDQLQEYLNNLERDQAHESKDTDYGIIQLRATGVTFEGKTDRLTSKDQSILANIAAELDSLPPTANSDIMLIGLAPDATSETQAWQLSARRAKSVALFLQSKITNSKLKFSVWGAGRKYKADLKNVRFTLVITGDKNGR